VRPNIISIKITEYIDSVNVNENTNGETERTYYQSNFGG
jgi:hypothetical protein